MVDAEQIYSMLDQGYASVRYFSEEVFEASQVLKNVKNILERRKAEFVENPEFVALKTADQQRYIQMKLNEEIYDVERRQEDYDKKLQGLRIAQLQVEEARAYLRLFIATQENISSFEDDVQAEQREH